MSLVTTVVVIFLVLWLIGVFDKEDEEEDCCPKCPYKLEPKNDPIDTEVE